MAIDTLAYTKHLEQAGVERRQAEAFAEAMRLIVVPDLATKIDLDTLENRLSATIRLVEIRSLGIIAAMLGLTITIIKWG